MIKTDKGTLCFVGFIFLFCMVANLHAEQEKFFSDGHGSFSSKQRSDIPSGGVLFDFDQPHSVGPHRKFTDDAVLIASIDLLCGACSSYQEGGPPQEVIDAARLLVKQDNEHKAQAHVISHFFFKHPYAKTTVIVAVAVLAGAAGCWMIS